MWTLNKELRNIFEMLKMQCFTGRDDIPKKDGENLMEIMNMLNKGVAWPTISERTGVSQSAIIAIRDYLAELDKIELDTKRRIKHANQQMLVNYFKRKDQPEQTLEQAIENACKDGYYLMNDTEYIFGNQEIKAPFFYSLLQRMKMGDRRKIVIDSVEQIKGAPKEIDKILAYMKKHNFMFEDTKKYLETKKGDG